ncbi:MULTISPECIES: MFS transporter [Streptomyces]|uniref:MFS family permease n=1 Tax=Streptomyces clavifer TaxID=68188 RepID=A0ABS4V379_9ACTN|nr:MULTISPECIES: MFS transporter [Streptomyces]KQX86303.1 MFS transporter [Streptomyces sp. Root1319]KQZ16971.1 MFS transporter [Streptomyces sp. Root55]MBP2358256.1 MFS family permease [Streptomyces clavifer]MDX2742085.1 MFS transporter [Streptomyces sp. NRRL_B-2557]WRY84976.1 MFS transporter [Streptomyces clavifer]
MERSLRVGRLATFVYFTLCGFILGMWIVHIPTIEQRVGISHAVLGWLLLLLGGGAFAGMQLIGPLSDRFGARKVVPVSAVLSCAALVLPGLATSPWTLGAALFVLGCTTGCLDVAMNAHAVQVERGYGRPVMSAFHAMFSIGGVFAALVGAFTLGREWSPAVTLGAMAALSLVVTLAAVPALMPPEAAPVGADAGAGEKSARRPVPRRIWIMAALALMLMLSEGVAGDWSALHLKDVLDASPSTAAFAYGAFATAMTIGRLLADPVAARFGPVAILRYGSGAAAAGLVLAALSPTIPVALIGWTVFGIGLSGTIPQLFSAAGHIDPAAAGTNVSRVAGLGYIGILAGPAVIGPMTHFMPLNLTFFLPVAFCVIACLTAPILTSGETRAPGATSKEPAPQEA